MVLLGSSSVVFIFAVRTVSDSVVDLGEVDDFIISVAIELRHLFSHFVNRLIRTIATVLSSVIDGGERNRFGFIVAEECPVVFRRQGFAVEFHGPWWGVGVQRGVNDQLVEKAGVVGGTDHQRLHFEGSASVKLSIFHEQEGMGGSIKSHSCVNFLCRQSNFGLSRQNDHLQSVLIGLHQHGPLMGGVEVDSTTNPADTFIPFAITYHFEIHFVPSAFTVGVVISERRSGNFIIAAHALNDVDVFNHRFVRTVIAV